MQMALKMSMQPEGEGEESKEQFQDPNFVNQLLGSLPGVDRNDLHIQNALRAAKKFEEDKEGEESMKE